MPHALRRAGQRIIAPTDYSTASFVAISKRVLLCCCPGAFGDSPDLVATSFGYIEWVDHFFWSLDTFSEAGCSSICPTNGK
jgi:hypothetical protein